jgi:hypothetical protein
MQIKTTMGRLFTPTTMPAIKKIKTQATCQVKRYTN